MNDELDQLLHRENIAIASISKRSMAFFIDELLLSTIFMIALWDSFANAKDMEEVIYLTNSFVIEFMITKIMYQTFFVYQYGATLGKLAMKIQVLEIPTLSRPRFASAFNRAVFRIISEMLFYLGFVWGMMDPYRRTWHDRTARTLVIDV